MYTGLSLSFCIKDIMRGFVPLDQVDKIISGTACSTPEIWDKVIKDYKQIYWSEWPEEAEKIARQLLREGRIEQPRLDGQEAHNIAEGHWLLDGKVVNIRRLYKSSYPIDKEGDGMTATGYTSRQLYSMEDNAQRAVAESEKWLLAREVNTYKPGADRDSRSGLEALGFQVVREMDDLFYEVVAPDGWTKETEGYWTYVKDAEGNEQISMFYKGAIYDRRAFLSFSQK